MVKARNRATSGTAARIIPLSLAAAFTCASFTHLAMPAVADTAPPRDRTSDRTIADTPTDWPFIRGPQFDGHSDETSLIDRFPDDGPPVLWTRALGAGYSGLTTFGERVYTQYQTLGGQYVICLDARTGDTLWEHRYEAAYEPAGMYPGPRATPTVHKDYVYFASPAGLVGCLNARSGATIWTLNVFEHFAVEPVEFGYSSTPVIVGDKLLLPVGRPRASMVALDADSGAVVWQSGNDPISHVPAFPISFHGRSLVVGYLRNTLNLFDLETGEQVLRIVRSTAYDEHAAWPIYREPYLWLSGPFLSGSELIELTDDPLGWRTVWKSRILSNDVASSVLVGEHLYGFDIRDAQSRLHRPSRGQFRSVAFLTGEPAWVNGSLTQRIGFDEPLPEPPSQRNVTAADDSASTLTPARGVGHASVIAADNKLILFNDLGELILARADPEHYEELGRARVLGGEICWTAPTLSDGRLLVRNPSRVVCLLLRRPESTAASVTGPTLKVADIPQTAYRDWAALVLSVEPQYAMDLPTLADLRLWYKVTIVGYVGAGIAVWGIAATICVFVRSLRRHSPDSSTSSSTRRRAITRWLHGAAAFAIGAAGTTLVSPWFGRFIFTWPLCLFAALAAAVYLAGRDASASPTRRWAARAALLGFLATCAAYYLLCRRLNLATEWVFLTGFCAALPLLVTARKYAQRPQSWIIAEQTLLALAYSAFYWASVGVMIIRYGTQYM